VILVDEESFGPWSVDDDFLEGAALGKVFTDVGFVFVFCSG
jgi:hypothetical protein